MPTKREEKKDRRMPDARTTAAPAEIMADSSHGTRRISRSTNAPDLSPDARHYHKIFYFFAGVPSEVLCLT
jgi:hypothetical protein